MLVFVSAPSEKGHGKSRGEVLEAPALHGLTREHIDELSLRQYDVSPTPSPREREREARCHDHDARTALKRHHPMALVSLDDQRRVGPARVETFWTLPP
jgi:hypothetical protein